MVVRNTPWSIALVAYCGEETKLSLNQKDPPSKFSSLDKQINKIVIGAFAVQMLLCIAATIGSRVWEVNISRRGNDDSYLPRPSLQLTIGTWLALSPLRWKL